MQMGIIITDYILSTIISKTLAYSWWFHVSVVHFTNLVIWSIATVHEIWCNYFSRLFMNI